MTTYRPRALFHEMRRGLDTLHNAKTNAWTPAVDISEDEKRYLIHADPPGVNSAAIEVNLEGDELTLQGKRAEEKNEKAPDWPRTERVRGCFPRRFRLPESADAEHIEAHSRHGVLEIEIPKQPKTQPRKIDIKAIWAKIESRRRGNLAPVPRSHHHGDPLLRRMAPGGCSQNLSDQRTSTT